MKTILLSLLFVQVSLQNFAQVTLPYYSGFENNQEQQGWQEFIKVSSQLNHWSYSITGGVGNSKSVQHDYSPSVQATVADNWFVSPAFTIENGGKLDSIAYMFTGFSQPENGDTIAVYLLQGDQNPDNASYKKLLFDFRGADYNADGIYRSLKDIDLDAFNGSSYIGLRYKNSDFQNKWLTVSFDDVAISKNPIIIESVSDLDFNVQVFPIPSKNILTVNSNFIFLTVEIYNLNSSLVFSKKETAIKELNLDVSSLLSGIYFLKVFDEKKYFIKKIVIEK